MLLVISTDQGDAVHSTVVIATDGEEEPSVSGPAIHLDLGHATSFFELQAPPYLPTLPGW